MTLRVGTRLGPYEVVGPLGAGGMGEVYRARDAWLNREVALKVLPEMSAANPERLARFEREAQALAALKHPHIGAIYGIEERPVSVDMTNASTSGRLWSCSPRRFCQARSRLRTT